MTLCAAGGGWRLAADPAQAHKKRLGTRYGFAMFSFDSFFLAQWLVSLGFFLLGLLILWLIIRGAVLSALRKHSDEQASRQREIYRE